MVEILLHAQFTYSSLNEIYYIKSIGGNSLSISVYNFSCNYLYFSIVLASICGNVQAFLLYTHIHIYAYSRELKQVCYLHLPPQPYQFQIQWIYINLGNWFELSNRILYFIWYMMISWSKKLVLIGGYGFFETIKLIFEVIIYVITMMLLKYQGLLNSSNFGLHRIVVFIAFERDINLRRNVRNHLSLVYY